MRPALIIVSLATLVACRAPAQNPPTRLGVLTTVLEARQRMFEQVVYIDGCSFSTMMDSVSSSMGTVGEKFAGFVRGAPGSCLTSDSSRDLSRVMSLGVLMRRGADQVDPTLPADVKAGVIMLGLIVQDIRSQESHPEEWYLGRLPGGGLQVLSMRAGRTVIR